MHLGRRSRICVTSSVNPFRRLTTSLTSSPGIETQARDAMNPSLDQNAPSAPSLRESSRPPDALRSSNFLPATHSQQSAFPARTYVRRRRGPQHHRATHGTSSLRLPKNSARSFVALLWGLPHEYSLLYLRLM